MFQEARPHGEILRGFCGEILRVSDARGMHDRPTIGMRGPRVLAHSGDVRQRLTFEVLAGAQAEVVRKDKRSFQGQSVSRVSDEIVNWIDCAKYQRKHEGSSSRRDSVSFPAGQRDCGVRASLDDLM